MSRAPDVVVGAGLAGLAAARTLAAAGRDVRVVEASDGVGGRVRTDEVEGHLLDRGFQVLLTDYPELPRHLDLEALHLQTFEAGALVRASGVFHRVVDPFRAPMQAISTLRAPVGSLGDKARLGLLRRRLLRTSPRRLLRETDGTTADALRAKGFSDAFVQQFLQPLVGGIQLDPDLAASRRMFDVVFRCLARGEAAVPSRGMGAITAQLAAGLEAGTVTLDTPVTSVGPGRVELASGTTLAAGAVVVATDGPTASRLLGLPPVGSKPASCVWFSAPEPPTDARLILLDGDGPARNVAVMSNVAPAYAPPGRALIAAAVPGIADDSLEGAVRRQLRDWWGTAVEEWSHLRTDAIPHGQPDQSPPLRPKQRVVLGDGLYVCGDHRDTASIQGALYSGRRCAEAVLAGAG